MIHYFYSCSARNQHEKVGKRIERSTCPTCRHWHALLNREVNDEASA